MRCIYFTIRAVAVSFCEACFYIWVDAWAELPWIKRYRKLSDKLSIIKDCLSGIAKIPTTSFLLFRLRTASRVRVKHFDNGFFANVLQVLDVITHTRPNCRIFVDWTLEGNERHFRYGAIGKNLWDEIFEPLSTRQEFERDQSNAIVIGRRLSPFLVARGRDYLSSSACFSFIRFRYHRAYSEKFKITNTYVIEETDRLKRLMNGRFIVGVHKRLNAPSFALYQQSFRSPTIHEVSAVVEQVIERYNKREPLVYLATDDLDCVTLFERQFGRLLIYRPGVQRVCSTDGFEVHTQEWGRVGVKDACDVLIDALLLSHCNCVLHLSSNVTTCVAFMNPNVELFHHGL